MPSTLAVLLTKLKSQLRGNSSAFTDGELTDFLNRAIQEYGNFLPREKTEEIALLGGTDTYEAPVGLVETLSITDVNGKVYAVIDLFSNYMTLTPTPSANILANLKGYFYHDELVDTDDESTYRDVDEDIILLHARAQCLDLLSSEQARYYKYTEGDITEDIGQAQKQLRAEANSLYEAFNQAVYQARVTYRRVKPRSTASKVRLMSRVAPPRPNTIFKS